MTGRILLAIDPGSREFGFAVFNGASLTDASVKSLRRAARNRNRLAVLKSVLGKLIANETPTALALEKNTFTHIPQNHGLLEAIREMKDVAHHHHVPVFEFAPSTIKKAVTSDALATKRMVARALCGLYPQLRVHLGHKHQWQERYYLNMFDAVACGLTFLRFEAADHLHPYAVAD